MIAEYDGLAALVTGGASGIGAAVVATLRDRGARTAALDLDVSGVPEGVLALEVDVRDDAAVRAAVDRSVAELGGLDVLVNNAGIGSRSGGPQRRTSAEGYELRFAVNYLAGFLLTHELLPLLMASAPARIVNVASAGQSTIDFDNVMLTRGYDGGRAYMQSKLAQVMFTFDLADDLEGCDVTVNCLHPATYMDTTMVRDSGVTPLSTVDEGAASILNLVESPALEGRTGLYFDRLREARANAQAYDASARDRLRQLSLQLVGLADEAARPTRRSG
jgi:NAD(P)-dependent dehydrogenase (short-subunit alcohol dehydrogenase family)